MPSAITEYRCSKHFLFLYCSLFLHFYDLRLHGVYSILVEFNVLCNHKRISFANAAAVYFQLGDFCCFPADTHPNAETIYCWIVLYLVVICWWYAFYIFRHINWCNQLFFLPLYCHTVAHLFFIYFCVYLINNNWFNVCVWLRILVFMTASSIGQHFTKWIKFGRESIKKIF